MPEPLQREPQPGVQQNLPEMPPPGPLRRLAAMFYDSLLLTALFMLAGALTVAVKGDAVTAGDPALRALLVLVAAGFFVGFWSHGGQTLGMRAWRVRVVADDGAAPTFARALLRFICAVLSWVPFGLGYLWMLVDRDKRAWHDRLSGTRLILLPKTHRGR